MSYLLDFLFNSCKIQLLGAGIAQLVERNLAKVEVASSRLVSRSRILNERDVEFLFTVLELAGVTKLVDVADLKSAGDKKAVRVRFPSPAPSSSSYESHPRVAFLLSVG